MFLHSVYVNILADNLLIKTHVGFTVFCGDLLRVVNITLSSESYVVISLICRWIWTHFCEEFLCPFPCYA